jgi:hypothetical protein
MLARSATAGQATFEPDEPDEDEEDDPEDEEDDELLPAFSPDFLPPLAEDLSPDEDEAESPFDAAVSDFLPSDPLAEAAAGSGLFGLERLSVR